MTLGKPVAIGAAVNGCAVYAWARKDGQAGRAAAAQAAKGTAIGAIAGLLLGAGLARRRTARADAGQADSAN